MPTTELPNSDQVGRYQFERCLGQGAMGRVYLARDPVLDRKVAVKLLRDDLKLPEEHREALFARMRQEARASARISHPNIVALYDMGQDPRLGLYLVFEYIEGITLKDRIARGFLGPQAVAQLALELGGALATAHAVGVLHRDIKPENVILAPTGAKIADFGIARIPESTLTRDGRVLGTPAYSSPESISHGTFSAKSDQFSMAATLYEALSMHRAFPGDDAIAVAARITAELPPAIAEVCGLDTRVDTVLMRAMAREPRNRFDSCLDFGRALAEVLRHDGEQPPVVQSTPLRPQPDLDAGPRPLRLAVGAAATGAILAVAALQLTRSCSVSHSRTGSSADAASTLLVPTRTDRVQIPAAESAAVTTPPQPKKTLRGRPAKPAAPAGARSTSKPAQP